MNGSIAWLRKEVKALFRLNETDKLWHMALLAALCMAIPLLAGMYYGHMQYSILACTGGLVILYLPTVSMSQRMIVMVSCSLGFVASFAVGLSFSFGIIPKILSLGLFTIVVHWICLYYNFKAPGSTFFIMLASIAAFTTYDAALIIPKLWFLAAGTALACVVALLYSLYAVKRYQPAVIADEKMTIGAVTFEACIIGVFVAMSLLLAYWMKLEKPYWVPISCLVVMKGIDVQHVWQRSFQRIFGTVTGLGLARLLLLVDTTPLSICITIPALQFMSELLVGRNYALALVFVTPMALLLAEVGLGTTFDPNTLIITRFADIVLGSVIGAIGGYIMYHQKLRSVAEAQMNKVKLPW